MILCLMVQGLGSQKAYPARKETYTAWLRNIFVSNIILRLLLIDLFHTCTSRMLVRS